jgi:hypothetical protein
LAAVTRLGEGKFFAPRASACGLLPVAHRGCRPDLKATLRALFTKLSTDETPMVRRAAATALGGVAESSSPDEVKAEILTIYNTLIGDEQDTVRQLVVSGVPALCKVLKGTDGLAEVISTLHMASKVRELAIFIRMAVCNCGPPCTSLPGAVTCSNNFFFCLLFSIRTAPGKCEMPSRSSSRPCRRSWVLTPSRRYVQRALNFDALSLAAPLSTSFNCAVVLSPLFPGRHRS